MHLSATPCTRLLDHPGEKSTCRSFQLKPSVGNDGALLFMNTNELDELRESKWREWRRRQAAKSKVVHSAHGGFDGEFRALWG